MHHIGIIEGHYSTSKSSQDFQKSPTHETLTYDSTSTRSVILEKNNEWNPPQDTSAEALGLTWLGLKDISASQSNKAMSKTRR